PPGRQRLPRNRHSGLHSNGPAGGPTHCAIRRRLSANCAPCGIMSAMLRSILLLLAASAGAADIRVTVDFSKHLRVWDGFGVNYVEASQTRDYQADPQEYGGFSLLEEAERQQILEMIFGPDGLKPGLLKMFLDPF